MSVTTMLKKIVRIDSNRLTSRRPAHLEHVGYHREYPDLASCSPCSLRRLFQVLWRHKPSGVRFRSFVRGLSQDALTHHSDGQKRLWGQEKPVRGRSYAGFSLLEMLIIVAIIGILVQLAVPSYQDRLLKSHRLQTKTQLMQAQISLEDCYILNRNYQACEVTPGDEDYTASIQATPHTFLLTLTPQPQTRPAQDTQCHRWQVDHKNHWKVFAMDGSDQSSVCVS